MNTKLDYLDKLKRLATSGTDLPASVESMDEAQLAELSEYMDAVLQAQMQSVDKMMESMAQSMKYIPNVFLQMMAKKYVDPALSARLTHKMTIKQVVGLTRGMPVDYVTEVAACQEDNAYAAEIMCNMKSKDIEPIIECMCQEYPVKALDIAEHLPDKLLAIAARYFDSSRIPEEQMTDSRRQTLNRL